MVPADLSPSQSPPGFVPLGDPGVFLLAGDARPTLSSLLPREASAHPQHPQSAQLQPGPSQCAPAVLGVCLVSKPAPTFLSCGTQAPSHTSSVAPTPRPAPWLPESCAGPAKPLGTAPPARVLPHGVPPGPASSLPTSCWRHSTGRPTQPHRPPCRYVLTPPSPPNPEPGQPGSGSAPGLSSPSPASAPARPVPSFLLAAPSLHPSHLGSGTALASGLMCKVLESDTQISGTTWVTYDELSDPGWMSPAPGASVSKRVGQEVGSSRGCDQGPGGGKSPVD